MAERVAGQPHRLRPLETEAEGAEGDAERVGVDRLEPEAGAVGADGLHADRPALDGGSERLADGREPFARFARIVHEALGERLDPDDFALGDAGGLLLLLEREGIRGGEATIDQHHLGRRAAEELPCVAGGVGRVAAPEDDDFARIAVKLGRNAMQRALVGRRMDDVAFGDRRIDRFGESRAKLDRCQLKGPAP